MTAELTDKTILVTGASGGVGRGVVNRLAAAGARLALTGTRADQLAQAIGALGGDDARFKAFPADLNDEQAVDDLLEKVAGAFGSVDGLVHTVGGYAAGDPVHAAGMDVWDQMIALNARIVYLVCGKVARHMLDHGAPGSISVILARAAYKGSKNHAAYSASKAAAMRIVESMALELRDHGIRVNGISPSTIDTTANREAMPNADFEKWVKPEQIGDLAVFLASDAAAAITGANIDISARS
jgi:NAD(P)-dependent dehydrogenase (short-subunit alcohol dehydrogenase family)